MSGFEAGKAWGEAVNPLARMEILRSGAGDRSALKLALVKAEGLTPASCEPFRIRDWDGVDAAWIASFLDGVRSTQTKAAWAGDIKP